MIDFDDSTLERYSRNILLKEIGIEGQLKLAQSSVLVIGAGGLGAPVSLYLAAGGVGTIGIADADTVELSNLQRQVIHFTSDIGVKKVDSAKNKMIKLNPDVQVSTYPYYVNAESISEIVSKYDFVIDGTDNFAAKFLINDACVKNGKPFSHGGILRFNGQTMTVIPGKTACYRCIFRKPPPVNAVPSCSQAGILGAVAGMLGTIQAAEALKYLTGNRTLQNQLLTFDALGMDFRKVDLKKQVDCPVCSLPPDLIELRDEEQPVCELKTGITR